ncbi:hypothetical protein [Gordonia hydrophobica]|uniref:DUF5642 domain-containing protein n=1 Tax=Gordonia hydrophobica TaxID=40516 RepID=A0ABZ2U1K7_9ACTN|nr:hypothetical protein [Gordonia hydrophobica]MBM7367700.1 hypothetical protein [Gordonia hydrophobica]
MATVAAVVLAVTACSVSGQPVRTPDLSGRAAPADAFPYGPGLPVQAPGVVSDITFRPLSKPNDPADCTPVAVDAATAQVRVGPGGPAGGTLTAMVVRAADSFDDFVAQAARCGQFALGGTVGTTVSTTVADDGVSGGGVQLERHLVMGPRTETSTPPTTAVTEFVAQRGDIRVYVQNRRSGLDALGGDELAATRALFDAARASAFPR